MGRVFVACVSVFPLLALGCGKKSPDANESARAEALAAASEALASPPVPPETPFQQIDKLEYAAAFALAKPQMEDVPDKDSDGEVLFGLWASKHMKWSDVAVAKDETSFALTRKDSDETRCA
jgi:hypothetical protein